MFANQEQKHDKVTLSTRVSEGSEHLLSLLFRAMHWSFGTDSVMIYQMIVERLRFHHRKSYWSHCSSVLHYDWQKGKVHIKIKIGHKCPTLLHIPLLAGKTQGFWKASLHLLHFLILFRAWQSDSHCFNVEIRLKYHVPHRFGATCARGDDDRSSITHQYIFCATATSSWETEL